nr:hypothetical protein [Mycoplasmopsis bovis]
MLSFSELGYDSSLLPFDPNGVILLDDSSINENMNPMDYLGLDDYIIDITTPANRAESNSYYVLAMELAKHSIIQNLYDQIYHQRIIIVLEAILKF